MTMTKGDYTIRQGDKLSPGDNIRFFGGNTEVKQQRCSALWATTAKEIYNLNYDQN